MGKINNIQVTVLDEQREYSAGVSLEKVAGDFQDRYPHRIIMARVNGKLNELHKSLDGDALVEFVTTRGEDRRTVVSPDGNTDADKGCSGCHGKIRKAGCSVFSTQGLLL